MNQILIQKNLLKNKFSNLYNVGKMKNEKMWTIITCVPNYKNYIVFCLSFIHISFEYSTNLYSVYSHYTNIYYLLHNVIRMKTEIQMKSRKISTFSESRYSCKHYPQLNSILMVENMLEENGVYTSKNKLFRSLPRQIQFPILNTILQYLYDSKKIEYGEKNEIIWVFKNRHHFDGSNDDDGKIAKTILYGLHKKLDSMENPETKQGEKNEIIS